MIDLVHLLHLFSILEDYLSVLQDPFHSDTFPHRLHTKSYYTISVERLLNT